MKQMSYSRSLAVEDGWDVIVCGSGPSGICAAVSAARQGQKDGQPCGQLAEYSKCDERPFGGHDCPLI